MPHLKYILLFPLRAYLVFFVSSLYVLRGPLECMHRRGSQRTTECARRSLRKSYRFLLFFVSFLSSPFVLRDPLSACTEEDHKEHHGMRTKVTTKVLSVPFILCVLRVFALCPS